MRRDPRAFLWDALQAIEAIEEFTAGADAHTYATNALMHSAVERKFEIVGEALGQLAKLSPELARRIPHLAQVVAFRNQLIHGYAQVSHAVVWNVAQDAVGELRTALLALMHELGTD